MQQCVFRVRILYLPGPLDRAGSNRPTTTARRHVIHPCATCAPCSVCLGLQAPYPSMRPARAARATCHVSDIHVRALRPPPQAATLHGEQYLELRAPLPPSGRLVSRPELVDIQGKGACGHGRGGG